MLDLKLIMYKGKAMLIRIDKLEWMRQKEVQKKTICHDSRKIGYPDKWKDSC
jgi:predicted metalloendopeptidase